MIVENQTVYWLLIIIFSITLVRVLGKILAPNYYIKQYIAKVKKPLSDTGVRISALIDLLIFGYLLIWVLEIKI